MIPKTPIRPEFGVQSWMFKDADGNKIPYDDIARDLTAYYTLMKKQEECGKTGDGHKTTTIYQDQCGSYNVSVNYCVICGADLTKGSQSQ